MIAKKKSKGKFIIKLMFIINIVLAAFLLLSYLAAYISPATFWPIAFFGIAYPFILLANLLFIILWLIVKRKYALLSSVIVIAGINNIFKLVQYSKVIDASEMQDAVKVISFNARNFDIYNYGKNWENNFTRKNQIFKFLAKEQADIVCFQEYVFDTTGYFNTTDTLKQFLKAKNPHIFFTSNNKNLIYFGIATYTVFPIIDTGSVVYNTVNGNICIFTDMLIGLDTVRVYNVHLESIRFDSEDYAFVENQLENSNKKKPSQKEITVKEGSERILKRMKKAYVLRAPQSELVAEHISKCPYPIILCGDFNDTPTSYSYHNISSTLTDAFIESGNGTGQSYAGVYPSFRIDYIMHSKEFRSYNFETVYEKMSDHYPVKCFLKFDKKD
jgi:endonuclease/exonuclease/phosphatase family metal-dependent hydrolase